MKTTEARVVTDDEYLHIDVMFKIECQHCCKNVSSEIIIEKVSKNGKERTIKSQRFLSANFTLVYELLAESC